MWQLASVESQNDDALAFAPANNTDYLNAAAYLEAFEVTCGLQLTLVIANVPN